MIITDAVMTNDVTTMTFSEPALRQLPDSLFNVNLLTRP